MKKFVLIIATVFSAVFCSHISASAVAEKASVMGTIKSSAQILEDLKAFYRESNLSLELKETLLELIKYEIVRNANTLISHQAQLGSKKEAFVKGSLNISQKIHPTMTHLRDLLEEKFRFTIFYGILSDNQKAGLPSDVELIDQLSILNSFKDYIAHDIKKAASTSHPAGGPAMSKEDAKTAAYK